MASVPQMPTNYDNVTINVNPTDMTNGANAINAAATDISDSLNAIYDRLNSLELSWLGQSATEADSLNQQWIAVVNRLFGIDNQYQEVNGSLDVLINGVAQQAQQYAATEQNIHGMFNTLYTNVVSPNPDTVTVHLQVDGQTYTVSAAPGTTLTYYADGAVQTYVVPLSGAYTPNSDNGTDAPYYTTAIDES